MSGNFDLTKINSRNVDQLSSFKAGLASLAKSRRVCYAGESLQPTYSHTQEMTDRTLYGSFYRKVCEYLNGLGIGQFDYDYCTLNPGTEQSNIGKVTAEMLSTQHEDLYNLCSECHIPEERIIATVQNLGTALYRYTNNLSEEHFATAQEQFIGQRNLSSIYPSAITSDLSYTGAYPAMEMFGANIQTKTVDLKTAMTLTLLKSYKGLTNRIFHRVANDSGVVMFVVPADEFYDLAKSQEKTSDVRDSWSHRNQIITLLTHPEPVDMELIPVQLRKDLDAENQFLLADNVMLPGVEVSLWDMSIIEGKAGYDQFNYTDLLSDNVKLSSIQIEIDDESNTEQFIINLTNHGSNTYFTHLNNTINNQADRVVNFTGRFPMTKDTLKADGSNRSTIFASITPSVEYIQCVIHFHATTNLQTTKTHGTGSISFRAAVSVPGAAPSEGLKELLGKLTGKIVGWSIDARYSEENFRKTNMAVRAMSDVYTYNLPDGRTTVCDFSHKQAVPEHCLQVASEVQNIGIDHRNLQIVIKTMKATADRIRMERTDPRYIENFDNQTVNKAFVSGRKVHPTIAIKNIDMSQIVNFRSSDMLSDIWTYMRACLNAITSEINYRSLLPTQLEDSPAKYKVITTTPILDCIFALPSIHENQMPSGKDGEMVFQVKATGKPVEFKTKLPNGVELEFVTCNFHYMKDLMILLPYRDNAPSSELNFAINLDGGQYSVNWSPTDGNNMTIRRSMLNTREYPIALCGIGAIITVQNYDHLTKGMFEV